jgi:hypothetical protein
MKTFSPLIVVLMISSVGFSQSLERQVIGSAGDYATSGSISLSYTVGEVATTTLSNGNLILTQGFQQPDSDTINSIDEPLFVGDIAVYPNPTSDIVIVKINTDQTGLSLVLTNPLGQDLVATEIDTNGGSYTGEVDMTRLAAGHYMLYLRDARGRVVTTYKVQKVN